MKANVDLKALIDQLGRLRKQQKRLEANEVDIINKLAGLRPGVHQGRLYGVEITEYLRGCLDLQAVRAKLGDRWVARHTRKVPVRSHSTFRRK